MRPLLLIALFILFFCMFFTSSIGGWLSLLTALIIEGILIVIIIGKKNIKELFLRRRILFGVVSASIFIVFIIFLGTTIQKRLNKFTLGSIESRIAYLKWTTQIIKDHPLIGTGIGNFKIAYGRYVPRDPGYTKHAHNSYLEIWAELGVGGLLLFLLFIFQLLRKGLQTIKNITNREDRLILAGIFSGICAFLIHNVIEFTFYAHSVALYWWFIAGLLTSRIRTS